jgi:hypothetical protein
LLIFFFKIPTAQYLLPKTLQQKLDNSNTNLALTAVYELIDYHLRIGKIALHTIKHVLHLISSPPISNLKHIAKTLAPPPSGCIQGKVRVIEQEHVHNVHSEEVPEVTKNDDKLSKSITNIYNSLQHHVIQELERKLYHSRCVIQII